MGRPRGSKVIHGTKISVRVPLVVRTAAHQQSERTGTPVEQIVRRAVVRDAPHREIRDGYLKLNCTDPELERLCTAADMIGIPPAKLVRAILIESMARRVEIPPEGP
jgi:hypothetical protein